MLWFLLQIWKSSPNFCTEMTISHTVKISSRLHRLYPIVLYLPVYKLFMPNIWLIFNDMLICRTRYWVIHVGSRHERFGREVLGRRWKPFNVNFTRFLLYQRVFICLYNYMHYPLVTYCCIGGSEGHIGSIIQLNIFVFYEKGLNW